MKICIVLAIAAVILAAFFPMRPIDEKLASAAPASARSKSRVPTMDAPFWHSAIAPESAAFREPSAVVMPPVTPPPVDHPSVVAKHFKTADVKALNFALAAWFDADPTAARDWLAERESLEPYQTALAMIVGKIACAGDPTHALEWATLLEPGPEQEQAVFDAYVLAARSQLFTHAQLAAAPLPEDRIAELLGGAAGD